MADSAVEFLLENLEQLLLHHAHLIKFDKILVEKLERDLRLFKAFLKGLSSKKRRKDEMLRELVRQIREVVYEAQDIIDAIVIQAAEAKSQKYFLRDPITPMNLASMVEQAETLRRKISAINGCQDKIDLVNLALDEESEEFRGPMLRKDNVVGFEDEAEKLIGYLHEETENLNVISIIGMPGLGKTTLAGKIFHDEDIWYEFPTRIWLYVSQEFTDKDVFLAMLRQRKTKLDEDTYSKRSAAELAREIAAGLDVGKFLIVMDDVWTASDWDKLRVALPKSNKTGKVLITSRNEEVGWYANGFRDPHRLRFLTLEESWLLLRLEVFGRPECPTELEVLGKVIASKCNGLPLPIVVIGGILVTKFSASYSAWEEVSSSVMTYLHDDPFGRVERIISLSYEKLPHHLRECFLYFGMFPEDFEIPAWNLIRMWIAEGLIQPQYGVSLEETAEKYLGDLISRNLVRVDKLKPDGRVKTCRIHDMLRNFCKTEAGNQRENFLQEIEQSSDGGLPQEVDKYRRLCIHSNILDFLSTNPHGPRVRSFVTFCENVQLPTENISAISAGFKLLRVLEAKPIKFSKIPRDFYHLVQLRYICLSLKLDSSSNPVILPAAFSKLWNIETLIVDTVSRTLEIKADIFSMAQLRHLKTKASATLLKPGEDSKKGEKLQTLGTISPESCTEEVLDRAFSLKKLGIRGKIALFLDGKIGSYACLFKLGCLEKLKLVNDVYPIPPLERKLDNLSQPYRFPAKLRSLTLSNTFLGWSRMYILGMLNNLEVLKLKDNAFVGTLWVVGDGEFRDLEFLHIERTDLVTWVASWSHFPRLKRLQLQNCRKLQEVPIGLADIPNFQHLELYFCQKAAVSARRIQERKKRKETKKQNETYANIRAFKLSIFPSS